MAKAREIEGLGSEQRFADVAARVVEVRAAEVVDHAEGVFDLDDVERLHDMRVATRRLRAALEVFAPCFDSQRHAAVLGEVKSLADSLGERRDRDVAIDLLGRFGEDLAAADCRGIETARRRVPRPAGGDQRWARARDRRRANRGALPQRGGADRIVKARRVKKLEPDRPLAENAARIVRTRLDELRSLAPVSAIT